MLLDSSVLFWCVLVAGGSVTEMAIRISATESIVAQSIYPISSIRFCGLAGIQYEEGFGLSMDHKL